MDRLLAQLPRINIQHRDEVHSIMSVCMTDSPLQEFAMYVNRKTRLRRRDDQIPTRAISVGAPAGTSDANRTRRAAALPHVVAKCTKNLT